MFPLSELKQFLDFFTIPFVNFNFVDLAIIIVVLIYALEGYTLGFVRGVTDFITFVISFFFGITFYGVFGIFLTDKFGIPKGFGNALGFFLAAFISEVAMTLLFRFILLPIVLRRIDKMNYSKKAEKIVGIIPGVLSALVLLSFVLTMIVALPLSPFLKNSVSTSKLGGVIVANIQGFDKKINNVFGGAVNDALTFLTIEPKSDELLKLNFQTNDVREDQEAEKEMINLVNSEREKKGLGNLNSNQSLKQVAVEHCMDMLNRGYFSHYTLEGKSPFDRMTEIDIDFNFAGENLALAPNTRLAMQGLMDSPGHRANILSENFGQIGVGVIDAGIYGEMFCQEFAD